MNTPPSHPEHVCFSGSPACSGCNPCAECRQFVQDSVIPPAFYAAGIGQVLQTLHTLIGRLMQGGIDPRQLGIDLSTIPPSPNDQADAFFRTYLDAFPRMHHRMKTDPSVRSRLVVSTFIRKPEPQPSVSDPHLDLRSPEGRVTAPIPKPVDSSRQPTASAESAAMFEGHGSRQPAVGVEGAFPRLRIPIFTFGPVTFGSTTGDGERYDAPPPPLEGVVAEEDGEGLFSGGGPREAPEVQKDLPPMTEEEIAAAFVPEENEAEDEGTTLENSARNGAL